MCQLSYVHTKNLKINRAIMYGLLFENSANSNKDGWGIYSKSGFRSANTASLLVNMGESINNVTSGKNPILGHVRLATKSLGIKSAKEITESNSHPFESERFVLAHNGTLTMKDESEERFMALIEEIEKAKGTDSELFLKVLTQLAGEDRDAPEALKEAMSHFDGKFAFLIYDKATKKNYAVRGKTAELHICYVSTEDRGEPVGYVINTNKFDMVVGIRVASNYLQLLTDIRLFRGEPVLLPVDSINLLEDTVTKVGDIEETEKVYVSYLNQRTSGVITPGQIHSARLSNVPEVSKVVIEFANNTILSLEEVDHLLLLYLGIGILDLHTKHLKYVRSMVRTLQTPFSRAKAEVWDLISDSYTWMLDDDGESKMTIYQEHNLEFPYFLNSFSDLDAVRANLEAKELALRYGY